MSRPQAWVPFSTDGLASGDAFCILRQAHAIRVPVGQSNSLVSEAIAQLAIAKRRERNLTPPITRGAKHGRALHPDRRCCQQGRRK
jgi:hypothetical protein